MQDESKLCDINMQATEVVRRGFQQIEPPSVTITDRTRSLENDIVRLTYAVERLQSEIDTMKGRN